MTGSGDRDHSAPRTQRPDSSAGLAELGAAQGAHGKALWGQSRDVSVARLLEQLKQRTEALQKLQQELKRSKRANRKLRDSKQALQQQLADNATLLGEATKTTADAGRGPQLKSLLAACRKLHAFTGGENTDKAGTIAKLKDQLDVLKRKSKGKSREGED